MFVYGKNKRNNNAETKQPGKKKGIFIFIFIFSNAVGTAGGSFLSQTKET